MGKERRITLHLDFMADCVYLAPTLLAFPCFSRSQSLDIDRSNGCRVQLRTIHRRHRRGAVVNAGIGVVGLESKFTNHGSTNLGLEVLRESPFGWMLQLLVLLASIPIR